MALRYFKATVEYEGTDFSGFQWQHETRTVQGALEQAIVIRTGQTIRLTGAGRTDAGVHALGQVVSFSVETQIPTERMALALNSALPPDVSIKSVQEVGPEFSARFSASSRVYAYLIRISATRSALWRRYSALCIEPLDVNRMQQAANELLGERDFASFTNALQVGEPTMRHLMRCSVNSYKNFVVVRMEANAFLRGMVRNTVGTLIQVGSGTRSVESMAELLHQRDRRLAGPSAVPEGLCLVKVKYGARRDYVKTQTQMIPSNLDGSP